MSASLPPTVPLPGDPGIEIALRRAGRARRITLRISGLDGRVTLSLPPGIGLPEALRFAQGNAAWIRGHLSRQPARMAPAIGAQIGVGGVAHDIVAGRAPALSPGRIAVRADRPVGPQVAACLRLAARAVLADRCAARAASLGRVHGRITLRDTRSRWGSCSSSGDLMFSWRLILAPPQVLDYVTAHEVAHLAHMDHSPAFWSVVARLCPDYALHRGWLRTHGAGLQAWDFATP